MFDHPYREARDRRSHSPWVAFEENACLDHYSFVLEDEIFRAPRSSLRRYPRLNNTGRGRFQGCPPSLTFLIGVGAIRSQQGQEKPTTGGRLWRA
jgi:hypothetical protein